jgi:hypothetical protein
LPKKAGTMKDKMTSMIATKNKKITIYYFFLNFLSLII